ncbi:MAG: 4Fe-4S dicluster domain-containing protein, partial [Alphaproteobacteria bacterium]
AAADHAMLRAGEIALVVAGYIRRMGFPARAHTRNESDVDAEALAERAGVVYRDHGRAVCPFIGGNFALAVVTTDMPFAADRPIAPRRGLARALRESAPHWLGLGGVDPGKDRRRRLRRPSHLSRYKMEKIARVERPTTLILDDEVPRVPNRAAFFERALRGDLGDKAQRERARFATKHPFAHAMVPLMRAMVPLQDGPVADQVDPACDDPARNAKAIKSLSYFLGADLTGICRAKEYTWHSHREDGRPIEPAHASAIVLLIDQGFETMEGASGDDWISGAQSMRGYLRGAEIAGLMAAHIRALGFAARAHSNLDSDVNHIPLILWAGLGEMSRIGELVLNPFVGPRFKSAIVTTDMPLTEDLPVDFGLQDMCSKCMKCARECPCDAISWGNKVMFNGYEIWKPDAERCTRYRVTNPHGSACGRCMKTCPYNHEGLLVHNTFLWGAIKFPFLRKWIAKLDDKVGNGRRNPVKQWWHDLEMVDGVCVKPKGANKRELDLSKRLDRAKQKIAYYHADMMPPPNAQDIKVPVDRKQALAAASLLETPADALARRALGGAKPKHYNPTPPADLK